MRDKSSRVTNIVFVFDSNNDLDMGAPVAWRSALTPDVNTVIIKGNRILSSHDYRLKFLRGLPGMKYLKAIHPNPLFKIKFFHKLYQKINGLDSDYIHRKDTGYFDFKQIPLKNGPTVFVIFYLCPPKNEQFSYTFIYAAHHYARSKGYGVVLLPHGGATVKGVSSKEEVKTTDLPDVALMNTPENGITFCVPPSITRLAGFPRFSLEWSEQLNRILPRRRMPKVEGKFVITFMLSKHAHDGSTEEQNLDAILRAASIPNAFVVIKPHTGNMNTSFLRRFLRKKGKDNDNIFIAGKNIQSRQLIERANVLLWTVSTVALDAVLLNKPLLRLSFMSTRDSDYAPQPLESVEVPTPEAFTSRLTELAQMASPMTYSPEERKIILDYCCHTGWDTGQTVDIVGKICEYAK